MNRDRDLVEQTLVSLIVESLGIALYELVADALAPGRVSESLRSIADDERTHLSYTRDLFAQLILHVPTRRRRRLRRLRTRLIAAIVVAHALSHGIVFAPIVPLRRASVRRRLLEEIERSLFNLPSVSLPPMAAGLR